MRILTLLLAVLAVSGCAGGSDLERCVQHSVEEGVAQEAARAACERVVPSDGG